VFHIVRAVAVLSCCAMAGIVAVGCDAPSEVDDRSLGVEGLLDGPMTIDVDGRSVHVTCSGGPAILGPTVVLMAGLGDPAEKLAGIQETLSAEGRVCSYDRLGEGASDRPDGRQTFDDTGEVLTAVLARAAGDGPVVLAGHSLGGAIAARYAPDHQDRVKGLVLVDATPPTTVADTSNLIPESATGPAAEVRAQILAVNQGENPEQLQVTDGEVRSAGDIPVEVIQHGQEYLAAVPEYGPGLEQLWADGQRKWLALSSRSNLSTATGSGHDIYVDEPALVVEAIQRVASQVTD
jgi:thioesterase domain-containing protein